MKYILGVIAAFCLSTAMAAEVVVSPQCPPKPVTVSVGGGLPEQFDPRWCEPKPDPRRASIQNFFNVYETQPQIIFTAMTQFGVTAAELIEIMDYRINIVHYMRTNKVADGFGGLKVWDDLLIDKFLIWCGITTDIDKINLRVLAQDSLDLAARRKALYVSYGYPIPDSIAPWEKI